ncbi:MAG: hypothetical protein AAF657_41000, partial [Acidobacteriota bacterium]
MTRLFTAKFLHFAVLCPVSCCWLSATIFLPALASGQDPACALETSADNGAGRLSVTASDDTWIWQARPGDTVRCDLEAHEPLDVDCLEASCSGGEQELRLFAGRAVEINGPSPEGPVDVEWRRFGAPGDASDRTAHRQLPRLDTPEPWTLYAAAEEDRLLRLRRP